MSYARHFKNKSGATKTYFGIEFTNNEIKEIPDGKLQGFARNDTVLADLASGDAIMSQDGTNEYDADIAHQIMFLQGDLPVRVQTEFEDPVLVPQFAMLKGTWGSGETTASAEVKIPGTYDAETRFIKDGYLYCDGWEAGTYISKCEIIDIDNKIGAGANYVAKSYIDGDVASASKGWYLWPTADGTFGECDIENSGGVGNLVAELYMRIEVTKPTADQGPTDWFANIFWCLKE